MTGITISCRFPAVLIAHHASSLERRPGAAALVNLPYRKRLRGAVYGAALAAPLGGVAGALPGRPVGSLGLRNALHRQGQSSAEAEFAEAVSVIDVGLHHPRTDKYLPDH